MVKKPQFGKTRKNDSNFFRIYVEKAGILEDRKKFLPARASDF